VGRTRRNHDAAATMPAGLSIAKRSTALATLNRAEGEAETATLKKVGDLDNGYPEFETVLAYGDVR
jgi:hypothetical protein